jgi:molybdopterin-synthase adenylyltransferase
MSDPRLESQSFLGPHGDEILANTAVGIVGLGGGGSHITQQLAHLGIGHFIPIDDDIIEHKNLNRLVGGTADDVCAKRSKVEIAERLIKSVNPRAHVTPKRSKWQAAIEDLRACNCLVGCVDSWRERDELERFARRFLIPYIDLGMDVHKTDHGFGIGGQVVLSSPGGPCLWCLGILTEERLKQEVLAYGKAGSRPQVVWANGVLASLAVGLITQLICPWHDAPVLMACCEFDGNCHRVETSRLDHLAGTNCRHFPADDVGDAFFTRVR